MTTTPSAPVRYAYAVLSIGVALIVALALRAFDLEGFLFPDTYNYSAKTSPEELVGAMVSRFEEVFTGPMAARASELGMTINQIVTLASIIEKEARVDQPGSC